MFLGNPTVNKASAKPSVDEPGHRCARTHGLMRSRGLFLQQTKQKYFQGKIFGGQRQWHVTVSHSSLPNPRSCPPASLGGVKPDVPQHPRPAGCQRVGTEQRCPAAGAASTSGGAGEGGTWLHAPSDKPHGELHNATLAALGCVSSY